MIRNSLILFVRVLDATLGNSARAIVYFCITNPLILITNRVKEIKYYILYISQPLFPCTYIHRPISGISLTVHSLILHLVSDNSVVFKEKELTLLALHCFTGHLNFVSSGNVT